MTLCAHGNGVACVACADALTPQAEADRRLGEAVRAVLADFGWDHATVRADVESGRLAETVEGCVMLAIERALREVES